MPTRAPEMPQAISYIRFSSVKQGKGSSVDRQQTMLGRWLEQNPEYELSPLQYADLGKSGWKGEHIEDGGGFAQLLEAVEAGAIKRGDIILVEALDRVGRLSTLQMVTRIIGPILSAGVSIVTLDDGQTYSEAGLDGSAVFLLAAKVQAAHQYSDALSRRLRAAFERKRKQARSGVAPRRKTPVWLSSEGLEIPEISALVKLAFEWYVSGLGDRRIATRIREIAKEKGIQKCERVNGTSVRQWLSNRTAIGYWGEIPDVYPRIVEPSVFYTVQQRLEGNREDWKKKSAPTKQMLSGLVKCGHCGGNMNVMHRGEGKALGMSCGTRARRKTACTNNKGIPKDVIDWIRIRTSLPYVQRAVQQQQLSASQKTAITLQGEIDTLSKTIGALATAITAGADVPEIVEQLTALNAERATLASQLAAVKTTPETSTLLNSVQVEHDLLEEDPIRLNAMLQEAGYSITVYADGLGVASGELYPFVYLGWNRTAMSYRVLFCGEEHNVISSVVGASLPPVEPSVALSALNPLQQLLRRQNTPSPG